ncbi:MAG: hypothetical protein ACAI35_05510 [Candidatus Methylacidiphilales bacterium]|nr:hypothetical protein [Candidatus Methylacidiphilales bacterium]
MKSLHHLTTSRRIWARTMPIVATLALGAMLTETIVVPLLAQEGGGGRGRGGRGGRGGEGRGGGQNASGEGGGGDSSGGGGGGQMPAAPGGGGAPGGGASTVTTTTTQVPTLGGVSMDQMLGKDMKTIMPMVDPSKGIVNWNGTSWNVADNRIFRARFEKYLNAGEETIKDDIEYQKVVEQILLILSPAQINTRSVDKASALLVKAATYTQDSRLSESLSDAIFSVYLAKKEQNRIEDTIKQLQQDRETLEWSIQLTSEDSQIGLSGGGNTNAQASKQNQQDQTRLAKASPYLKRLTETETRLKINQTKTDMSELAAKIQYQALVLQFFMQRRFQHVIMAGRFYRALFDDGDNKLQVNRDAQKLLTMNSGLPATISVLETMSHQALADVKEGIESYKYLLDKNELASATERLQETFVMGEYVSAVRTLPRDAKRRALEFSQKGNQLLSAMDVKDFTKAEQLIKEIEAIAKDFDGSRFMGPIETAKKVSAMHLAKAKNAAMTGDGVTMEAELKAATEIWPRNPALEDAAKTIFAKGDVQNQAVIDFDRLIAQKNYRQIYDDRMRFIAAMATYPDKAKDLKKVLDDMVVIEMALVRAQELAKRDQYAGAWESVDRIAEQYPDDLKLAQVRADYTTRAAEFVNCIRRAQDLEKKKQFGSSLTWFLKARRLCPTSEFAKEGIDRIVNELMPTEA